MTSRKKPRTKLPKRREIPGKRVKPLGVRIVGGRFRGRRLEYGGDQTVRPMKDRVREALFNLIGPSIDGMLAVDLFGGTGALGLEALSRGASRAVFCERHFPTAAILRRNVETLGAQEATTILTTDTFLWFKRGPDLPQAVPWAVFCSPPYEFYTTRTDEMLALIGGLIESAPKDSIFAIEGDIRADFSRLPLAEEWDVREYPPAVVGVFRKLEYPPSSHTTASTPPESPGG